MLRATSFICFVVAGCSRPVMFQVDDAIWVIAPPLPSEPSVTVQDDEIVVSANIEFDENATILPASFEVLNEVASLSRQHPRIKTIVVERSKLSESRTKAVLAYLAKQGVADDIAISYAPDNRQAVTPATPSDDDEVSTHAE